MEKREGRSMKEIEHFKNEFQKKSRKEQEKILDYLFKIIVEKLEEQEKARAKNK